VATMTDLCQCPTPKACREDGVCWLAETRGLEDAQTDRFRDYARRRREIEREMARAHKPTRRKP